MPESRAIPAEIQPISAGFVQEPWRGASSLGDCITTALQIKGFLWPPVFPGWPSAKVLPIWIFYRLPAFGTHPRNGPRNGRQLSETKAPAIILAVEDGSFPRNRHAKDA